MRILPIVLLAAIAAPAPAFAQASGGGVEDQMLLEGTPPTSGAERPSEPQISAPDAGIEIAPVAPDATMTGPVAHADWVGLTVVDGSGTVLGEISGNVGGDDRVILTRPDGGVQTVPSASLRLEDGRLVAEGPL